MNHCIAQLSRLSSVRKRGSFVLLSGLLLGAIAQPSIALPTAPQLSPRPAESDPPQRPAAAPSIPRSIIWRMQRDVVERENLSRWDLQVHSQSRGVWRDGCLGLAADNEFCTLALVEGYRVELTDGNQIWAYRSDRTGQTIRQEPELVADLPSGDSRSPEIDTRILQTIANQLGEDAATLRIVESQPATWDGCMGVYEPNQACTMIAIFGARLIVANESQNWVYHIDQNGSRIVQNDTASAGHPSVMPSFIPEGNELPTPGTEPVVFRSSISGGLGGVRIEKTLLESGLLRTQTWRMGEPTDAPIEETQLSLAQVNAFRQLLDEQRFGNFNRMRYITEAAFADYPTITFEGLGTTVEYIDLIQTELPPALQTVIEAWEQL
ncbi:MAG: hypothetical protein KME20_23620 [Kaiparowitsia implicata GSE-PSE-MK54-09C]|nr:hypothetical protein [Kaiparowitsia implicata GSE-PSE-MK54-09C]